MKQFEVWSPSRCVFPTLGSHAILNSSQSTDTKHNSWQTDIRRIQSRHYTHAISVAQFCIERYTVDFDAVGPVVTVLSSLPALSGTAVQFRRVKSYLWLGLQIGK